MGEARYLGILVWVAVAGAMPVAQASVPVRCPMVFFDLGGNSIVETPEPFGHGIHFVGGAARNSDPIEYLDQLQKLGHPIGLIVNFPDKYLDDYVPSAPVMNDFTTIDSNPSDIAKPRRRAAKVAFVKKLIQRGWKDDRHPMDEAAWKSFWARFGDRFHVPPSDAQRKDRSPWLFDEATAIAKRAGCRAIYQTQLVKELRILIPHAQATPGSIVPYWEGEWDKPSHFLSPERFKTYLRSGEWRNAPTPEPPADR